MAQGHDEPHMIDTTHGQALPLQASRRWRLIAAAVLLVAALATRFLYLAEPREVVFDEVHYGKHVSALLTGTHTFSGHPPLAVELIALAARLGGYDASTSFGLIGNQFSDPLPLRFLPALAGSLIPLAAFGLALTLGVPVLGAFLAGIILVFDNALLVQSRLVLLDPFLILFGLLGLMCFLRACQQEFTWKWFAASGIFFGMAMSVKWNAVGLLLVPTLILAWDMLKAFFKGKMSVASARFWTLLCCYTLVPLAVYAGAYAAFVELTPNPGDGDAYVAANFRAKNILSRIIELNAANYNTNFNGLTATHPYGSKFFTWPFLIRPIFYWTRTIDTEHVSRIYFLGNPVVWWGSTVGVAWAWLLWRARRRAVKRFLYGGYVLTMLPFLSVTRVTFLYHYLSALIFAVLIGSCWLTDAMAQGTSKKRIAVLCVILTAVVGSFLFFAPLSYGTPLTAAQYESRVFMNSWR